ncbi:MAG: hypothetical protein AAFP76_15580, partial [Bacteroidota bacterium]
LAAEAEAKRIAEEQARLAAEAEAKRIADEQARLAAEAEAKRIADEQARLAAEAEAKRIADEQARLAAEAEAKRIAEEEQARLAAEAEAKRIADEQARLAAEAEAKRIAEEQARLAAEAEAKRIAEEEQARLAAEAEAKRIAEEQARLAAEAEAKRIAEEQARLAAEAEAKRIAEEQARERLVKNPTDPIGKSIGALVKQTEATNLEQNRLLKELEDVVAGKEQDLKDLKEENDLREQNIFVEPKPFKSITKENEKIELIKIDLDAVILRNKKKILDLEGLLEDRVKTVNDPNDATNAYYRELISQLKAEQEASIRRREMLVSSLEQIKIATGLERKRRIKRASYDNDEDRYTQDREMLNSLRRTVSVGDTPYAVQDFDFGRKRSDNIEILKDIGNVESGYYLVMAVHSNVDKRDEFLIKVISSGYKEVDFFYDVSTSEYYIYYKKFGTINEAESALETKVDKPYTQNLSLIKIEN